MKLRLLAIAIGLALASVSLPSPAIDLMQTYYKALENDPTFKKANSDWESAKQNIPIARAAYLTQMSITGNAQRQFNDIEPPLAFPANNGYNNVFGFVVSATQPLFNLPAWDAIQRAHASVKSATANYTSAGQDLMVRTAKAYIGVLQAHDQLRFQLAQKRAVAEQLKVAEQQFRVGLIAVTSVYNARSSYDQAVAASIADQNTLNDRVEELAAITGEHYTQLKGIAMSVPLVRPKPNNINTWTDVATRQNYQLIADNYAVIAARERIKEESTGWAPQLNLAGQYTYNHQSQYGDGVFNLNPGTVSSGIPPITTNNVVYGLSLNFPFLQGGLVSAQTRQAQYDFLSASNQREFTYRNVISNTRQAFLGIITGISKIKADYQSIKSARKSLDATKAGYEVGTQTMLGVLDEVSSVYQTEQQYADDQYNYILDIVELKFYAGTLSLKDLQTINRWLRKNIKLKLPAEALRSLTGRKVIRSYPKVPTRGKGSTNVPDQDVANIEIAKSDVSTFAENSQPALPAPHATRLAPAKNLALPMPRQTRHFATAKPERKPRVKHFSRVRQHYVASTRKPLLGKKPVHHTVRRQVASPRKPAVAKQAIVHHKKVVSLDEQVLPLYDKPKSSADTSNTAAV